MKILAIETSCDETAAAVLSDTKVLSSIKYTQSDHAVWGGVVPSIAKREHEKTIGPVVQKALQDAKTQIEDVDAIAVTVGPGLAIALEVGIKTAKDLATKYNKKFIAVNHIEGHILSPLLNAEITFPALALVVSGGHTELDFVEEIGRYRILAEKIDDALGEALDKAARLLELPYPGAPLLEAAARDGNPKAYALPLPMAGQEDQGHFSYSGLKSAFARLVTTTGIDKTNDLAAAFQNRAFQHLINVTKKSIEKLETVPHDLLVGGGVIANQELRSRLTKMAEELGMAVHFAPMDVTGDNAAMIGLAAFYKAQKNQFVEDLTKVDRLPRLRVDKLV